MPTLTPAITDPNAVATCGGLGVEAVLHGDASDPALVWLELAPGVTRIKVVWPSGYVAVFDPLLQVVDPSGNVVLREGDQLKGACMTFDRDVMLLEPPFEIGSPSPSVPTLPTSSPSGQPT